MANNANITATVIPNFTAFQEYAPLENVLPSLKDNPPIDWDHNTRFGRVPIWSDAPYDRAQILANGPTWLTAIAEVNISLRTAVIGMRLALSLRSILNIDQSIIYQQPRPDEEDTNLIRPRLAITRLPEMNTFSTDLISRRTPNARQAPGAVGELQGAEAAVAVAAAGFTVAPPENQGNDTENKRLAAYCYLAAYLMKLLIKDPSNVVSGVANMKTRYESFYGTSQTVSQFTLNITQAQTYKDALSNLGMISSTYVHALAYTHNDMLNQLDERERGLLGYLGFLHFSYSGLHSVNLMMDLQKETNASLSVLLSLFHSDVTAAALRKMRHLLSDVERTSTHPDRPITHRYCTHFGQEYYGQLRSRNCPHLVYTLVAAMKVFKVTEEYADPERIAAVQSLSANMKNTLRIAGTIVGNTLKSRMLAGTNASAAYTLAIAEQGAQPQPEQDDDQEWDVPL
ncbi:TPA_asm: N [Trachyspermum ammi virus 1]|uniref:Nucleoprotein n=1 Tax=Trachyspermum ammi virus 1 TaxID=2793743 RepID=A0A8D9UIQ0_9RHAB|nr:N [Trachyspermum ammi virus 1] [Trachyspermum ammi virus 1]DAF42351.1 TPA_asm: N [Trachyspermum ammi virus 1]